MTEQNFEQSELTAAQTDGIVAAIERGDAETTADLLSQVTAPESSSEQLHDWSDETVEQIRLAETAAQRSLCDVPDGDLPDELAQALERRVEVNLTQHDGGDVRRVGSTDPTVRELEAPWSRKARRAAGSIDHHTQEGQS